MVDKLLKFIFDLVIAIIIMFGAVLIYFGLKTEKVIGTMDSMITEDFLTEMKKDSSLNYVEYEDYIQQLSMTGTVYDLQFEHKYNIWEPEYRMRTIEEIIAAQKAAYTGDNIYHYREVVTSRPTVNDPIDNSGLTMNTETNESVLAGAVNTPSSGHTHTDSCYAGHKHKGGDNTTFTHTHAHNVSQTCTRYVYVSGFNVHCNNCGTNYYHNVAIYYWDGSRPQLAGMVDNSGVEKCKNCNGTWLSIDYKPRYYYSCGYVADLDNDGWYDEIANGTYRNYTGFSAPQPGGPQTHTSGCYSYHISRSVQDDMIWHHGPYNSYVEESSVGSAVHNMWSSGFNGYCYVTKYIMIGFMWIDDWRRLEGIDNYSVGPDAVWATYMPFRDTDGSLKFKFINRGTKWWHLTPNESVKFPDVIGPTEFFGYDYDWVKFDGSKNFRQLTVDYLGYNYNMYGGYLGHKRLYSGTSSWDHPDNYTNICGFDHSKGVNQWVLNCGLTENATLLCPDRVVSITPTHPLQSVYTGEALITTVRAAYADGSQRTVKAITTFTTGTPVSNKIVILSYTDSLGGKKTYPITVNVVPRNRTCTNGHIYNLNHDGSDPSCPFCNAYIANIRIINPMTSTLTITLGTTLQDNGLKLLITYMDGHTETITEGYIDNLDNQYLGTKMVTIGYKGANAQILVTTVCAKLICDICGFLYELYPDGTNPGCPRCISKTPVFTGNVLKYDVAEYTQEILEKMYQKGSYDLSMNNTFRIRLQSKSPNLARSLLKKLYPSMSMEGLSLKLSENIKAK
jgi:hypothetical protein